MNNMESRGAIVEENTTPAQVAAEYGMEPAFVARLFEATFLAMLTLIGDREKSPVQFGVATEENGKAVTLVGGILMTPDQADRVAAGTELGDVLAAVCRGDVYVNFGAVDEA